MQEIYPCAGALLYFVSAIATADADWALRGGRVYSMDAAASHQFRRQGSLHSIEDRLNGLLRHIAIDFRL